MTRKTFTLLFLWSCVLTAAAQPRYDIQHMNREPLNRGVVAIRDGQRVMVSWRTLRSDAKGEKFDLFRNGMKLNTKPMEKGGTCFVDEHPLTGDVTYEVHGGGCNGSYLLKADAPDGYIPIAIEKPEGGTSLDGNKYSYHANDASVGDVDGDGQYEIFLKWEPSNSKDNMFAGFTARTFIDCYRLDGSRLWRIDLGDNIRSGAHFTQMMVYDFDGDGKAELMVKTGDGSVDGQGHVIGDPHADWRHGAAAIKADPEAFQQKVRAERENALRRRVEWDSIARTLPTTLTYTEINNMRRRYLSVEANGDNKTGRILDGPEYLSVFNGLTGAVMDTQPYVPGRGVMTAWGDDHGNRSERYLAGVGYLDGRRASAIFCRGYYTRTVVAAWDWDGHQLTNRWTFDSNDPRWSDYAGQGNHNLRVADVDGDGCDEITYGSMAIDHDGTGLYNTGMGHGDAIHLTVFDPTSDRLQVWDCHENRRDGSDFRDARTGEVIFQIKSNEDVGALYGSRHRPHQPGIGDVEQREQGHQGHQGKPGDSQTTGHRDP